MTRLMNRAAALAAAGVLVATLAMAFVPDPTQSTVPKCLPIAPNGGLTYTVRIMSTGGGPINASSVVVTFNPVGDSLVCWCTNDPTRPPVNTNGYVDKAHPHTFTASTNASGYATFNLWASGCVELNLAAIPGSQDFAAEVFADFVKMAEVGTVSPDVVDNAGRKATDNPVWNPAGFCAVGLADATKHTTPLALSTYSWCTDINCDHAVTLGDATILTPFLANATNCAGNAGN